MLEPKEENGIRYETLAQPSQKSVRPDGGFFQKSVQNTIAAPATAERTRAAAGAIPINFKEAAPDELKVEGVEEAVVELPEADDEANETGIVAVAVPVVEGVVREPEELKK